MTLEEKAEKRTEEKYACSKKVVMPLEAIGYKKGYIAGYKEALKMKVNTTTISDAPLMEREQLQKGNNKLLDVINNQDVKIADLEKQMKKFDEGCNIIEELSKFINDCKWYNQHGYEEKQKELIEKVNNFFEGVEK